MIESNSLPAAADKPTLYAALLQQAEALFEGERDSVANAANLSALIWHGLPDLNWAGVYRFDSHELVLGPFQGKPACIRIALGKGVCGTAAPLRRRANERSHSYETGRGDCLRKWSDQGPHLPNLNDRTSDSPS